jgi:asparagine synthetase B (glutamine-hydrolysing)
MDNSQAPFQSSSFAALLAPKAHRVAETTLRDTFQHAVGAAPNFVIQTADFTLVVNHSPRTQVASDPSRGITVLVHGDIYSDDQGSSDSAKTLLSSIDRNGIRQTALDINGAYSAIVITPTDISIIIDRVGSRKIFHSEDAHGYWITTTLTQHPRKRIDAAGVASLMINRYQYGGRTLYENVRTLDRACIHTFSARGLISQTYWQYEFSQAQPETFTRNLADKIHELNNLIQRAVKRRLPRNGNIWCSLSGGGDSRAIFGRFADIARMNGLAPLTALSYGLGTDDDPKVAERTVPTGGRGSRDWCISVEASSRAFGTTGRHCEGLVYFYLHALSGIQQVAGDFTADDVLFVGERHALAGTTSRGTRSMMS